MRKKIHAPVSGVNNAVFGIGCAAALIGVGLFGEAQAEEGLKPKIGFNAAIASDYAFRGVSQTLDDPAVQAGVDVTHGIFYTGAWASNVDFGDGETDAEVDIYAGVRPQFAGLNWDLGVVGYLYTGQPDGADYNYAELKAAASRNVGTASLGAALYYSPDFFGASEDEDTYAEINASYPAHERVTVSGAVGQQWVSSDLDYVTWNLGAAWQATDHLALDLRYYDTDGHDLGQTYDSRVILSLKAVL
jgi:uncharacterized protein (TIGR02001 family)